MRQIGFGVRSGILGVIALCLSACGGSGDEVEAPEPTELVDVETPAPETETDVVPVKSPTQAQPEALASADTTAANPYPPITPRPPCGGSETCINAGSVSAGHGGPAIEIHFDPDRDDAIVRWGSALGEIMDCADGGETIAACVAVADIEQICKDEFDRLTGLANEIAAFDAVFLTAGSPCRPEEGQP